MVVIVATASSLVRVHLVYIERIYREQQAISFVSRSTEILREHWRGNHEANTLHIT